ncbi:YncE family protein [Polyangium jinanense]|uniref:Lipoprotein n=1 Tax=Polyangium jinanense TaxID=2829994 RepID=A0A9X4AWE0_9BACT|nr:hypothetical protein [Polyangium jinanense]MDC3958797.1 hypothetical protein [Polyangium jinanense]MDC3985222.1 hypothetical protein [Polyangium jinanense]
MLDRFFHTKRAGLSRLGFVLSALVGAACGPDGEAAGPAAAVEARHPSWRRARVAVADGVSGALSIFDVAEDAWMAALPGDGPVSMHATESGDFAVLISSGRGEGHFLRAGVSVAPHDDHLHIYKFEPSLHELTIEGAAPGAVLSSAGQVALFFEGSAADGAPAQAAVVSEEALRIRGETPVPKWFVAEAPHRGAAAAVEGGALVTRPLPGDPEGRAEGVSFVNDSGSAEVILPSCPALSGAAPVERRVAFACEDGVLVVEPSEGGEGMIGTKWPYPGDGPACALVGHGPSGIVVGNLGPAAVFRIDAGTGASARFDVGAETCLFGIEPRGEALFALTSDGALRRIELATGAITMLDGIVPPFACEGQGPRHGLALMPDRVFVTAPGSGEVLEIDAEPLVMVERHVLGGAPSGIVVLGLDARNIDLAPGAH